MSVGEASDLLKPREWNEAMTDHDYVTLAEHAASEAYRYISNTALWNQLPPRHEGFDIFEHKSDLAGAVENRLLIRAELSSPIAEVEKMLDPSLGNHSKWDSILESAEVIGSWPEKEIYLTRNLIKRQYILSPRESIDVMKVLRRENGDVLIGWTGAPHANYPLTSSYVRTHQFLGGYLLQPCGDTDQERTKLSMLFYADLNLPVPRFIGGALAKFKPDLLVKSIENLRTALQQKSEHI